MKKSGISPYIHQNDANIPEELSSTSVAFVLKIYFEYSFYFRNLYASSTRPLQIGFVGHLARYF